MFGSHGATSRQDSSVSFSWVSPWSYQLDSSHEYSPIQSTSDSLHTSAHALSPEASSSNCTYTWTSFEVDAAKRSISQVNQVAAFSGQFRLNQSRPCGSYQNAVTHHGKVSITWAS